MSEEILDRHPVAAMLEENEPEAVEYWLYEPDIHRLIEDHRTGRIDHATFKAKADAWKEDWLTTLREMDPHLNHDLLFPDGARAPLHVMRTTPTKENPPPANDKPSDDLQPQKTRGRGRAPSR